MFTCFRVTLYAEFLPVRQRGKCVVLLDVIMRLIFDAVNVNFMIANEISLQSFWALGACIEVLLALIVMPTLGWRWLLALSSIPVIIFACVCPVSCV